MVPATAIYLHFHGGGMMIGAPEMSDYSSVDLRDRFGMAVVSVDYRLAPEHPHPAGPDDGVAVAEWLLTNGEREFGTEPAPPRRRVGRWLHVGDRAASDP